MRQLPVRGAVLAAAVTPLLASSTIASATVHARNPAPRTAAPVTAAVPSGRTRVTTVSLGDLVHMRAVPGVHTRAVPGVHTRAVPGGRVAHGGARAEGLGSVPPSRSVSRSVRVTVPTTSAFSAVGVTWRADPAVGRVSVAVRTRRVARGTWSGWLDAGDEPGPLDASTVHGARVRGGTDLVWTGSARGVDLVVSSLTGAAPRDVRLDMIDPGEDATAPRRVAPKPAAAPAPPVEERRAQESAAFVRPVRGGIVARQVPTPPIFTRHAWGADETKMTWPPEYVTSFRAVVLHHTATPNNYTRADVPKILRSIYHFHAVSRGWGDIGYNVLVDRFGRAWQGRFGGQQRHVIGAHAGGFNANTAGIALIGDYSKVRPLPAQSYTVAHILAWWYGWAGIFPGATTVLTGGPNTRFNTRVTITVPVLYPHKLTSRTACPGRYAEAGLPWLRSTALRIIWSAPVLPPRPRPTPSPTPVVSPTSTAPPTPAVRAGMGADG